MRLITDAWYENKRWILVFYPLSVLYRTLARVRKNQYLTGKKTVWKAPVPVIIVGNISVGGSGKTPLCIALVEHFKQLGYKPGIVSRGYGAQTSDFPRAVLIDDNPADVGDEPLLMARRTGCPVIIDPDRVSAAKFLLEQYDCDLLISDDGMQHYALGRDIEIAVVDSTREFGNQHCIPAGPLREPIERLDQVDFIVYNGQLTTIGNNRSKTFSMELEPDLLVALDGKQSCKIDQWQGSKTVHAVAGIGNPQRFFTTLTNLDYEVSGHAFADHHAFSAADFSSMVKQPVIMTEKDAVKCNSEWLENGWFLRVSAELSDGFFPALEQKLQHK